MFSKILIANRGEIAIRITRACKELGIKTVAVYSEADANALHVRAADEAILIGSPAPKESYLNIEKIIKAATERGAEAIHPGYGFLSENANFAEAVEAAGITFIGPSAKSIRGMGDKAESKISMIQAGVPTVPGWQGEDDDEMLSARAREIGFPVLIKAAAGGGGKGMRVAWHASDLAEHIASARREAQNAFGEGRLIVEKYIAHAHHIEFQVFGDKYGNLIHLFERECSVQRRHQKIIEETPSPMLTPGLRSQMGDAAVKAAQAVGYFNAGTVEFILDPKARKFYFLEMNTRLQVEHPITELVTGIDLAQWQIRVAAGEHFPFDQDHFIQRGHAIECRIYAEDVAGGFLPSTGKLLQFIEPKGPGIRVDSGFASGSEVTHFYDPLLAKLIVHAEDRDSAIRRAQSALREMIVHGVISNVDFLQDVLAHPDFQNGIVHTRWIESVFEKWSAPKADRDALIAAALSEMVAGVKLKAEGQTAQAQNPWETLSGFRIGERS